MRGWLKSLIRKATLGYSRRNRKRKAASVLKFLEQREPDSVLLVGVIGDESDNRERAHAQLVERLVAEHYPVKMGINIKPVVTPYPFTVANVCDMPFESDFVDFALANAVIEHVGTANQRRMVDEMTRVAKSWVITTPNRWFPVESHTHTMFLHWTPQWRRRNEDRYQLLSLRKFRELMPEGATITGKPWSPTFTASYARE